MQSSHSIEDLYRKSKDVLRQLFDVQRIRGRGQFGVVVEARYTAQSLPPSASDARCAIKLFDNFNEARTEFIMAHTLKHVNCLQALVFYNMRNPGMEPFQAAITYDLMQVDLTNFCLETCRDRTRHLGVPYPIVNSIAVQVLAAIKYMHKNLSMVHGDIKPENILLSLLSEDEATELESRHGRTWAPVYMMGRMGTGRAPNRRVSKCVLVRIGDFGLSKNMSTYRQLECERPTKQWIAPSSIVTLPYRSWYFIVQCWARRTDDAIYGFEVDVWAFACTLSYVLRGGAHAFWPNIFTEPSHERSRERDVVVLQAQVLGDPRLTVGNHEWPQCPNYSMLPKFTPALTPEDRRRYLTTPGAMLCEDVSSDKTQIVPRVCESPLCKSRYPPDRNRCCTSELATALGSMASKELLEEISASSDHDAEMQDIYYNLLMFIMRPNPYDVPSVSMCLRRFRDDITAGITTPDDHNVTPDDIITPNDDTVADEAMPDISDTEHAKRKQKVSEGGVSDTRQGTEERAPPPPSAPVAAARAVLVL